MENEAYDGSRNVVCTPPCNLYNELSRATNTGSGAACRMAVTCGHCLNFHLEHVP